MPYFKILFQKETHLLAHYSSSFTRLSPNTTTMVDKVSMTPQRWKGFVRSTHPKCLKIFMMQYLMTKSDPPQKKEESFKTQGLWQSCITWVSFETSMYKCLTKSDNWRSPICLITSTAVQHCMNTDWIRGHEGLLD